MTQPRPDILLIVLDTLRRDRLSVYNPALRTSPHLHAFAEQATCFERAVSPAQWTIPAHASLFTGVYPTTHQVTQADGLLSGSYPTLAEILHAGGYHTAGFCNNPLVGVLENDLQRGFAEFYNYAGAAVNRPLTTRRGGVPRRLSAGWARFARAVSNRFAHSDRLFQTALHPLLTPIWTRFVNYKGHTRHSIDDLIAYWDRHASTRDRERPPLFAFLNLMGAHLPYRPQNDVLRRIDPEISRDRAAQRFMRQFNADAARWASPDMPPLDDWQRHIVGAYYDAEIAAQDAHLGRLLDHLRDSGTLDNTLVLILADHGEGHGDHGFFGHSFVVYQELVHVPLILHDPRQPVAERVAASVSTRRVFHTVLDAARMTPPLDEADPNANVHGLSLLPSSRGGSWLNGANAEPDLAFAEAIPPHTFLRLIQNRQPHLIERLGLNQTRRAVYQGARKLATVGDSVEALFDVQADPQETRNLADQQADLTSDLLRQLDAFVLAAEHYRVDGPAYHKVSDGVVANLRALGYFE